MAFYLTSNITIGDYTNVKPNKVTWKTDVGSFTDSCIISIPRVAHFNNKMGDGKTYDLNVNKTGHPNNNIYNFKEGDKVEVLLGYNNKNEKRFVGFVRNVKMSVPVELECEGYGYLLYNVIFNKTYSIVTVKELLKDLTASTDIKLSDEIPEIPLKNVRFKNATGIQVLEWLKKECSLAVYFNFDELYVGTLFGKIQKTVKVALDKNVIKDDDFQKKKVDNNIKIVVREKNAQGEVKKTKSDLQKYSNQKEVKIKADIPSVFLQQIVNRLQIQENYAGYEGNIQLFLVPYVNKGMRIDYDGWMDTEKTGSYFVQSVQGEFGMSGGRQTVQLGFLMN